MYRHIGPLVIAILWRFRGSAAVTHYFNGFHKVTSGHNTQLAIGIVSPAFQTSCQTGTVVETACADLQRPAKVADINGLGLKSIRLLYTIADLRETAVSPTFHAASCHQGTHMKAAHANFADAAG